MNIDKGLLFLIVIGIPLVIFGAKILFSKKYLDEMYEKGWWKREFDLFGEKGARRADRYRGGSLFFLGLILIIGSIIAILLDSGIL